FFGCGVERTVEAIAGELAGHDAAPGRRPPIGEGEDEGERLDAAVGRDADVELAVALSAALAGVGVLGAVAGLLGDAPVAGRVMAVDLAVALDRARGRGHGRARAGTDGQPGGEDVVLVDEALRVLLVVEGEAAGPDGRQEHGEGDEEEGGERAAGHRPADAAVPSAEHPRSVLAVTPGVDGVL